MSLFRHSAPPTLSLVLVLALAGCALRPRSTNFAPVTAAEAGPELDNYGEAIVPARGLIVVQGDDVVYGTATRGGRAGINGSAVKRTSTTITESMRRVLKGVRIVNRGYPGDSVLAGAKRWSGEPVGDLLILSYGFGDAKAKTPAAAYKAALGAMIRHAHAQGAAVFVVPSPPVTDLTLDRGLAPYAALAREAAAEEGAEVFEPFAEMTRVKAKQAKGAAQTSMTYIGVAGGLVQYIKVAPPASSSQPPQTGQAGSGATRTVRVSAASAS